MDFTDSPDTYLDEFIRSINHDPDVFSPTEDPPECEVGNKKESEVEEKLSAQEKSNTTHPEIVSESKAREPLTGFVSEFDLPFLTMNAPTFSIEPPTPTADIPQASNSPVTSQSTSRLQAQPNTSFVSLNAYDSRHMSSSSPNATIFRSPSSSQGTALCPLIFGNGYPAPDQLIYGTDDDLYANPKDFRIRIARSIQKEGKITPASQIRPGHQRDLSGESSITSSSAPSYYDFCPAIDPSAIQPPLASFQNELRTTTVNGKTSIISPFINQTLEQGPDGVATGKYQRPLTSTGRPSHARKTPPGHVKRPRNAFILFRSHACSSNLIPSNVEKDHRQISRIVSHMWKNLPATDRIKWEREAEAEKELHRKLHPDYRYKPVYRRDGPVKKKQSSVQVSAAVKRKNLSRGKGKVSYFSEVLEGLEYNDKDLHESCGKTKAELQQEREEEIRCEAVAKVVMETKLSGINLSESQLKDRVTEEVRSAQRKDATILELHKTSPDVQKVVTQFGDEPDRSLVICATDFGSSKHPEQQLAPPQPRRKSQLNRANSAPPPPSPLRTMHARDIVYNPKARGNRELSPDFPKNKLALAQEDIIMSDQDHYQKILPSQAISESQLASSVPFLCDYSRFAHTGFRDFLPSDQGYNPTSQGLEPLSYTSTSPFGEMMNFGVAPNRYTTPNEEPTVPEFHYYPSVDEMLRQQKVNYEQEISLKVQLESYKLNCDRPSLMFHDLGSTSINGQGFDDHFVYAGRPTSVDSFESASESMSHLMRGDDQNMLSPPSSCDDISPCNLPFPTARRQSNRAMTITKNISYPKLAEALEAAKSSVNPSGADQEAMLNGLFGRRQSVVLDGLGEFPILEVGQPLLDFEQFTVGREVVLEGSQLAKFQSETLDLPLHTESTSKDEDNVTMHEASAINNEVSKEGVPDPAINQNSPNTSFSSFLRSFDSVPNSLNPRTLVSFDEPMCTDTAAQENFPPQFGPPGTVTLVLPQHKPDVTLITHQAVAFESAVDSDRRNFLILTPEQAQTEGLIDQLLKIGYGVTYPTDVLEGMVLEN